MLAEKDKEIEFLNCAMLDKGDLIEENEKQSSQIADLQKRNEELEDSIKQMIDHAGCYDLVVDFGEQALSNNTDKD